MSDRRSVYPAPVGASALLTIFAVLCLTVFALLSLSTVRANGRLSDRAAQAVNDYYAADCRAQEILARLRAGQKPEGVSRAGNICSYTCPISDSRTLVVEVAVDGSDFHILRWQAVSTQPWQAEEDLPVWDGEDK
ncbi:MAG: hypothetical protein J6A62_01540 [Oscillospiraceae bacterium]|nr:hypothetical protein [Oscillospiraceae bacterium]